MSESNEQQPNEGRIRRWWRSFFDVVEGMETSGFGHLADRIDALEARMRRLEAVSSSAVEDSVPLTPQHGADRHG
jgi:hypothetical protein